MESWKKWAIGMGVGLALGIAGLSVGGYVYRNEIKEFFFPVYKGKTFRVVQWNTQALGDSKASRPELMRKYADKLSQYDVAFVQEIRDSSGSAFEKLCRLMQGYEHKISSRAGRSVSKEQYGVLYKRSIKVEEFKDFNPDKQDRWERPPIKIVFGIGDYRLTAYNIHTKPSDVPREMKNLENAVENRGNVMVLGDLNASGNYYKRNRYNDFSAWLWVIKDDDDTTVAVSRNAYDRIILNSDAKREFISNGFDTDVTKDISDHYPVWVEMAAEER
jgi:deoxyribonuclease-1-like protein